MAIACDYLNYELELASRQATNTRRQVDELLQEIENGAVGTGIAFRIATLESFVNQINTKNGRAGQSLAQSDCTPAKIDELTQLARATRNEVSRLKSDLNRAQRLWLQNEQARNTPDTTPANSAGEEAEQDKKANVEGSKVTNPPLKTSGSPNNTSTADQPATTDDTELSDEDAVSRVQSPRTSRRSQQTQSGEATTNDDNPTTNQSQSSGVSTTVQGQGCSSK